MEPMIADYFPIKKVSEEAIKEKKGRSPTFQMHFWWARKPLISSRASILLHSLSPDFPKEELEIQLGLDNVEKQRAFNKTPNIKRLQEEYIKIYGKSLPTLFDPFSGGGSIPYEALRLGFNVIANDYNPVAWIILKATIEYPKLFGNELLIKVEELYKLLINKLDNRFRKYYPKSDDYFVTTTYMYAWAVSCIHCSFITPLINNWVLKKKPSVIDKRNFDWIYLTYEIKKDKISFKVVEEQNQRQPSKLQLGNVKRGNALCLSCNNVIKNKVIVKDISSRKLEIPLCLLQYNHQTKQKEYIIFDEINTKFFNLDYDELIDYNAIPNFQMPNKIVPAARYLDTWDQLMNPRQRFFFSKFTSVSHEIIEELGLKWGDEWKPVLAIYTALVMGKMIDFNSRSTSWAAKEGIRNSLAFRRPSMCWDHTEINPFSKHGSGNLKTTTRYILKGIETAITHLKDTPGSFQLLNTSIMKPPKLEKEIDIIVTDPPYADDVQYSELSEFFYSWEQFILIPYFSSLVHGNTPRDHDISSNNIDRTIEFAEMGFELSMKNIYNILSPNGKLSLFYAHSSFSVWSFVIKSLINSKFRIVSTFPVHTESKDNVIALGKASIMTSTLISASKREGVKIAFFEDIQDDLRSQASENIKKYFDIGFRGTDLSMAALGSTLKILSNYSAIKTISGNIEIQDILKISRDLLTEVILGEIPNVDNITKCYLFSRILGQTQMEFKDLSILMNSLHLSLEEIRNSEIFKEQIIAKQKIYCISDYLTRDICQNYVIDQIHEGFRQFEHQGINGFWLNIRANKEVIKQVLHIILLGIDNGKLKPIRDSDSIKAEQILETIMN